MNTPYGGKLINRFVAKKEEYQGDLIETPFIDFYLDSIKISEGAYSPLEGFNYANDIDSIINQNMLPNGLPWTIPIVFTTSEIIWKKLKEGDDLFLRKPNGGIYGYLNVEEKYFFDKKDVALKVYGTLDESHPNVNDILHNYTNYGVAGKLYLFGEIEHENFGELNPTEVRNIIKERNWKGIAAYQARNPPHVAHEYLQKTTLEMPDIDGLFIHIVVGRLKKGDYKPNVIIEAYKRLIENYHKPEKVIFSPLNITMRYGGPKAALFLAIIRRNYGATHYIIGRDQAGVGKFYDPYAAHQIFDKFNIGMKALKFTETFFCRKCNGITSDKVCPHGNDDRLIISQTKIRDMLIKKEKIPAEIIRPEVAEVLYGDDVLL
jgi:ATP sulphurylase